MLELHKFDLRAGQRYICRDEIETLCLCVLNYVMYIQFVINQKIVRGVLQAFLRNTNPAGRVPLRVDIEEKNFLPLHRKTRCEVDIGRCLTNAAFLIEDRN